MLGVADMKKPFSLKIQDKAGKKTRPYNSMYLMGLVKNSFNSIC